MSVRQKGKGGIVLSLGLGRRPGLLGRLLPHPPLCRLAHARGRPALASLPPRPIRRSPAEVGTMPCGQPRSVGTPVGWRTALVGNRRVPLRSLRLVVPPHNPLEALPRHCLLPSWLLPVALCLWCAVRHAAQRRTAIWGGAFRGALLHIKHKHQLFRTFAWLASRVVVKCVAGTVSESGRFTTARLREWGQPTLAQRLLRPGTATRCRVRAMRPRCVPGRAEPAPRICWELHTATGPDISFTGLPASYGGRRRAGLRRLPVDLFPPPFLSIETPRSRRRVAS